MICTNIKFIHSTVNKSGMEGIMLSLPYDSLYCGIILCGFHQQMSFQPFHAEL